MQNEKYPYLRKMASYYKVLKYGALLIFYAVIIILIFLLIFILKQPLPGAVAFSLVNKFVVFMLFTIFLTVTLDGVNEMLSLLVELEKQNRANNEMLQNIVSNLPEGLKAKEGEEKKEG
ncbi:hypothetical protein ACFL35_11365 [Candidatus Riflebacteria bacterium]